MDNSTETPIEIITGHIKQMEDDLHNMQHNRGHMATELAKLDSYILQAQATLGYAQALKKMFVDAATPELSRGEIFGQEETYPESSTNGEVGGGEVAGEPVQDKDAVSST